MVPAGRIGDIYGRRRALLARVALFGPASAQCALAPSAELVIGFRALQGMGAALIFPVSVSVLTNAFPAVRASHAIGLAYGIAGLGALSARADSVRFHDGARLRLRHGGEQAVVRPERAGRPRV